MIFAANLHAEVGLSQKAPTAAPVTNADVVGMTAARLADDVVVGAIQEATATAFDLSPAALVSLKSAGLSDRVIQAMQARAKTDALAKTLQANQLTAETARESSASEPCRIFITEEEPTSHSYVVIQKEVQAGKKFYGGHDDALMKDLAALADKVGADAIIKFHEWRAPSKWSWAAAKAGGMAVKWTADGKATVSGLKGQCWKP